jgi:membrane glycosyltransferase
MPICNENVARVFAGLRATYESVERSGELSRFSFFVLSDSNDADVRIAELAAWHQLCRDVDGSARIFYRWRLPLHGRARRRQRDERRLPAPPGTPDGGEPRCRHHPDRALRGGP